MDVSKHIFVLYRIGHIITSTKLSITEWYTTQKTVHLILIVITLLKYFSVKNERNLQRPYKIIYFNFQQIENK